MFETIQNVREEAMKTITRRHEELDRMLKANREKKEETRTKNSEKLDEINRILKDM